MAHVTAALALLITIHPGPTAANTDEFSPEWEIIDGLNRQRAEYGLPMLFEDGDLSSLASQRSGDMAERGYFSHTTPEGLTVFDVMAERGYAYGAVSENLFHNPDQLAAAPAATEALLSSPTHRANLLSPGYSRVGVGIAGGQNGAYFTLLLGG
jgi:uncharacterized protein YkwD